MRNHLPHIRPRASPALRSSVLGSGRPQPADYQPLQAASSPGLILQAQRSELCSRTHTPFQFSRVPDPPDFPLLRAESRLGLPGPRAPSRRAPKQPRSRPYSRRHRAAALLRSLPLPAPPRGVRRWLPAGRAGSGISWQRRGGPWGRGRVRARRCRASRGGRARPHYRGRGALWFLTVSGARLGPGRGARAEAARGEAALVVAYSSCVL